MRDVLLEAHPLVEECYMQNAVKRGPVVSCLEPVGLPARVCCGKFQQRYTRAEGDDGLAERLNKLMYYW